jgi:type IV fimbrial biogenesis protein FimT
MKKMHGFTLIELMIALILLVILITIAAPNFARVIERNRITSSLENLYHDLMLARSEAIKRNSRVTMCKSTMTDDGTPTCTTNGDWGQGWIVFTDNAAGIGNANAQIDEGEELIASTRIKKGISISGNSLIQNYVSYVATGRTKATSGARQPGTFTASSGETEKKYMQELVLSNSGRPRIEPLKAYDNE